MQANLATEVLSDLQKPLEAAITNNLKSFFTYVERNTGRSITARELQAHYKKFSVVEEDDVIDAADKVVRKSKKNASEKVTCAHKMLNGVNAGNMCPKTAMDGSLFCSRHKDDPPPKKRTKKAAPPPEESDSEEEKPKKRQVKKAALPPEESDSEEEKPKKKQVKKAAPPPDESDSEEEEKPKKKRARMTTSVKRAPKPTRKAAADDVPIVNLSKRGKAPMDEDEDSDLEEAFEAEGSD
jgi:outer membrane biosynthesis protein TonB